MASLFVKRCLGWSLAYCKEYMYMEKTLSVAAINNGTVIDHITAGYALTIIRLLELPQSGKRVTIGLNLESDRLGKKDLIKVEGREISEDEINHIAIFSPFATINIIRDFSVIKKFSVTLPTSVVGVVACPNPVCVTNHEPEVSRFSLIQTNTTVLLHCSYCEKTFTREEVSTKAMLIVA